jgi:sulfur carrier protein
MTLNVLINQRPVELPSEAAVSDALATLSLTPPFAVAVNTRFVPRGAYSSTVLKDGDQIEVISPVTGG